MKVLNAGKKAMGEHGANYEIGNVKEVFTVRVGPDTAAVNKTHKFQNTLVNG